MRTPLLSFVAAALAVVALGASALASDPVRLLIEPPKDVRSVEASDPGLDIQIVPADAAGQRVPPGGNTIEVSATDGDLTIVKGPYSYRYVPPGAVDQPKDVKLRAWFKQNPDVKGELTLTLMPTRPYNSLILQAPATSIELGKAMEFQILGVKPDGSTVLVANQRISMNMPEIGAVEFVTQSVYKYSAPGKSETKYVGSSVHLRAYLERYPKVAGELSIVISAEAPPGSPGGGGTQPPRNPPSNPPPGNPPPSNPGPIPPKTTTDPEFPDGVVWPSGNVMLAAWRVRPTKADPWPEQRHKLPKAGDSLISRMPSNIIRVVVLRDDVAKAWVEWYVADKKNASVKMDDTDKDGRMVRKMTKSGHLSYLIEMETPEQKPIVVDLMLQTQKGQVLKETFVFERGDDDKRK